MSRTHLLGRSRCNRSRSGMTLTELLLVAALVSFLVGAIAPVLRMAHRSTDVGEERLDVVQNARIALDHTVRSLRQARTIEAVSGPGDAAGFIEFSDRDGNTQRVELPAQVGDLHVGSPGSLSPLAGPVNTFTLRCFDSSDALMSSPVDVEAVRSIVVTLVVGNPANETAPVTLESRILVRRQRIDISQAHASPGELWPPNHKMATIRIEGIRDIEWAGCQFTVTGITQDESVNGQGDGNTSPDAEIVGGNVVRVRSERSGTGNGRVYEISYTVSDGYGSRSGTVTVGVPHSKHSGFIDDGQLYNSLDN